MTEWIISSTVLMLIVIGLRTVLKGRISLGLQYALWLLVLVRLLVPVNFTQSALSIHRAADAPAVQAIADIAGYQSPVQSFDEAYAEVVAKYEADGVDVDSLSGSDLEALEYEAYEQMKADVSIGEQLANVLMVIWIIGMGVTALCLVGSNLRFALGLRRSRREIPRPGCPLRVYVTEAVDTPCLFGPVKPAIYLTAGAPWDEKAMEHILTHELTHYRHGDHIWAVLRCVCLVLHWYNPLVWVCAGLSRRDGELACDEASIRTLGEDRRTEYGRTLIEMTCQKPGGMAGLAATTMVCSKKSLRERIQLLARHPKTAAYTLVLVILVAALAVGCTFTDAPDAADPTEPTTVETEPTTPIGYDPEVLAEYQDLLAWDYNPGYYRALGIVFESPQDLPLYFFFYNGASLPPSGSWDDLDQVQRDFLVQQGFMEEMDIQILPAEDLEAVLQRLFGVGLADVQIPAEWVYNPDTDCYYTNHNDAWGSTATVTGYQAMPDGTVRLYCIAASVYDDPSLPGACDFEAGEFYSDVEMILTLRPMDDERYQIVSNVFAEDAGM